MLPFLKKLAKKSPHVPFSLFLEFLLCSCSIDELIQINSLSKINYYTSKRAHNEVRNHRIKYIFDLTNAKTRKRNIGLKIKNQQGTFNMCAYQSPGATKEKHVPLFLRKHTSQSIIDTRTKKCINTYRLSHEKENCSRHQLQKLIA